MRPGGWSGASFSGRHAEHARLDSRELLALVAELYAKLAKLRKEVSTLRQKLQRLGAWFD